MVSRMRALVKTAGARDSAAGLIGRRIERGKAVIQIDVAEGIVAVFVIRQYGEQLGAGRHELSC